MTTDSALDAVVMEASRDVPAADGQQWIDVQDGKRVTNRRFWGYPNGTRHFLVSSRADRIARSSTDAIPLSDFEQGREIGVIVAYEVSCPPGNEEQVAIAFSRGSQTTRHLHTTIELAIRGYLDGNMRLLFENGEAQRREIARHVSQQVEQLTSLKCRALITFEFEDQLRPLPFDKTVSIRVENSRANHSASIQMELAPRPDGLVDAVAAFPALATLEDRCIIAIQEYFLDSCRLQDLHQISKSAAVAEKLRERLDKMLRPEGREVKGLPQISIQLARGAATDFVPLNVPVRHTPYEWDKPITISNDLQLTLVDAALWEASGHENLKDWAESTLDKVIEQETFGCRYLDFLLRFAPIEARIRNRMCEEAGLIGYEIQHLISKPELKESRFLEPNTYTFTFRDLPTKHAGTKVDFEIVVPFSIPDLSSVEQWLNRNVDLEDVIQRSIRARLEAILHQRDPESIYMRFESPAVGETNLSEAMAGAATNTLRESFHADVELPSVRPLDTTSVSKFVNGLINSAKDFQIEVSPLGDDGQKFVVSGKLTIIRPCEGGWPRVAKGDFDLEDIVSYYKKNFSGMLNSLSSNEHVAYVDTYGWHRLSLAANDKPVQAVKRHFGIEVHVDCIDRERSDYENRVNTVLLEHMANDVQDIEAESMARDDAREHLKKLRTIRFDERLKQEQLSLEHESTLIGELDDDEEENESKLELLEKLRAGRSDVALDRETLKEQSAEKIAQLTRKRKRRGAKAPSLLEALDVEEPDVTPNALPDAHPDAYPDGPPDGQDYIEGELDRSAGEERE